VRQFRLAHFVPRLTGVIALRILCLAVAIQLGGSLAATADVTFNITLVGEAAGGGPGVGRFYGDVWGHGNYAYVGSDVTGGGISIFDISDPANPQFLTMYPGNELEDVEVHNGIGYFGSDASTVVGTGVDIVDLSNPASPIFLSRVNGANGGHNKVHTLTVSDGFLYTADNVTDVIKIFNVSDPVSPQFVASLDLNAPANVASHEVVVENNRLFVASKWNGSTTCCGWTHIYDVANVGTTGPVLLKAFESGPRTHTSRPTPDGNTLIVAEERPNGEVHLYDISMINQPNDPNDPVLLATLNRTNVGIEAHSPHIPMVLGNLMFVSWYEAGLQVFNIADPANPEWVGAFDTFPGTSTSYNGNWGVYPLLGLDKVLLSDRTRGLIIVDATGVVPTGDFNFDGVVDGRDFLVWQRGGSPNPLSAGDLADWQANFGANSLQASGTAVPEPGSLGLLIVMAVWPWGRMFRAG